MPAPVRPPGDTRQLIVEFLERTGRPMTWPEIARAVGITAGYRTQRRMLELGQIQQAGFDPSGTQLYAASSQSISNRGVVKRQTTQSQCRPSPLTGQPRQTTTSDGRDPLSAARNAVQMSHLSFKHRLSLLNQDHMRPLSGFREQLLSRLPGPAFVPNFDPVDAGINASVLLLLATPGRVPRETLFTSLDNPSETSKNLVAMVAEAQLLRDRVLMWNLVPWDINDASHVCQTSGEDRHRGTKELLRLLRLLPRLKAIVFFSDNAQKAIPAVQAERRDLHLIRSPHPSNRVLNTMPCKRDDILAALKRAAEVTSDV